MNYKKLTLRFSLISAPIVIFSTVLLLLCFKFNFDAKAGYFVDGVLPTIFLIFYIAGLIISFVAAIMLNKAQAIKTSNEIGNYKIPLLILAMLLTACAIAFNIVLSDANTLFLVLGTCFFAVYALLCAANKGFRTSAIKILLIYLSAGLPISMIIYNNSNVTRHINSVENTLTVVFGLAFMIYILYEAKRIYTGMHSRWHYCSMLLVLHTGATLSISYILAYLSGNVVEKSRLLQAITILLATCTVGIELFKFVREAEGVSEAEGASDAEGAGDAEGASDAEGVGK